MHRVAGFKNMRNLVNKNSTPLLIGFALAALPILYFAYNQVSWNPLIPHEHLIQNGLSYVFLVLFSYYNHTYFVPNWYLNKRYKRYISVTIICILSAVYLPYRIEQWAFFKPPKHDTALAWAQQIFVKEMMFDRPKFDHGHFEDKGMDGTWPKGDRHDAMTQRGSRAMGAHGRPPDLGPMPLLLPGKLAMFFMICSVSSLISILIQATARLRKVENDQLQAELRQLKAQIQPHFLFNTLNSIYALAIRNDERTADTIVQLSEFLRYLFRDANREHVALATELSYIDNYIGLQKARLRDAVRVNYQLEGDANGFQIAPLILFSFIENAFKYGVNPEEDSPIEIHLSIQENRLRLFVANNKVQVSQLEASTGIGLANTRERLRLIYPDTHQLSIDDTGKQFQVTLFLTLA
jgi:hypothetical protein